VSFIQCRFGLSFMNCRFVWEHGVKWRQLEIDFFLKNNFENGMWQWQCHTVAPSLAAVAKVWQWLTQPVTVASVAVANTASDKVLQMTNKLHSS
jgi:hypothetical protein